jgi:hypothetical protein
MSSSALEQRPTLVHRMAELALLLPYHDIKLVMFGVAVQNLVEASWRTPNAVANQSPVYAYRAPDACGAGAITVHLHGATATWAPDTSYGIPDVLVACNAGLGSYHEWMPVIRAAHMLDIPFGVTEYAEQSAEHQRKMFPEIIRGTPAPPREEYEIALNPFQRPGQRGIPSIRLPNVSNGFTIVVVGKS